jgi:hypothetical protein
MYYPYLRGKQFELIALREFADVYSNYKIVPIIEPVKSAFNSMNIAINTMRIRGLKFVLILNPQVGDIKNNTALIEQSLANELADDNSWYPAFIVTNNNQEKIYAHINEKQYDNVFLICKDNLDTSAQSLLQLFEMQNITNIIINANNNRLKRLANKNSKSIIRLDDNFMPQNKNKDYVNIPEEMFSEEYRYFQEDGFSGISDYTVLPSDFIDGGMLPSAIAVHWTYEKDGNTIWVKHFVSDNNDGRENIQGKFLEAGKKTVTFFNSAQITNNTAIEELTDFVNRSQYPGLGVIKKLSIKNHIELLNKILCKEE